MWKVFASEDKVIALNMDLYQQICIDSDGEVVAQAKDGAKFRQAIAKLNNKKSAEHWLNQQFAECSCK